VDQRNFIYFIVELNFLIIIHRTTDSGTRGILSNMSSLTKKQKLMLNLLLLQEADEEHAVIKHAILRNAEKNKTHDIYLAIKIKCFFLVRISKIIYGVTEKKSENFLGKL